MREGGRGRRATCYLQTLRYKQAIADFKKLLTLEPQNQLVRMQLDSTQKILRKVEFEKVCNNLDGGKEDRIWCADAKLAAGY